MLGLSWADAILADVMAHKLDSSQEEETLLQTKGEALGAADLKLAIEVLQRNVEIRCPAENVIKNDGV